MDDLREMLSHPELLTESRILQLERDGVVQVMRTRNDDQFKIFLSESFKRFDRYITAHVAFDVRKRKPPGNIELPRNLECPRPEFEYQHFPGSGSALTRVDAQRTSSDGNIQSTSAAVRESTPHATNLRRIASDSHLDSYNRVCQILLPNSSKLTGTENVEYVFGREVTPNRLEHSLSYDETVGSIQLPPIEDSILTAVPEFGESSQQSSVKFDRVDSTPWDFLENNFRMSSNVPSNTQTISTQMANQSKDGISRKSTLSNYIRLPSYNYSTNTDLWIRYHKQNIAEDMVNSMLKAVVASHMPSEAASIENQEVYFPIPYSASKNRHLNRHYADIVPRANKDFYNDLSQTETESKESIPVITRTRIYRESIVQTDDWKEVHENHELVDKSVATVEMRLPREMEISFQNGKNLTKVAYRKIKKRCKKFAMKTYKAWKGVENRTDANYDEPSSSRRPRNVTRAQTYDVPNVAFF